MYSPKIQSQIFTASVSLDCDFHKCSSGFLFVFPLGETGSLEVGLEYFHFHRSIAAVTSVVSDSVRPYRQQPPRLPHLWDFLGKSTGVGRHCLLCLVLLPAKSLQSCPTLCDPMDCSLPGFSVHGILQARTLEWVAISFSTQCS